MTEEEIKGYATSREELKVVGDYFRLRAEKYEVLGTASTVTANIRN